MKKLGLSVRRSCLCGWILTGILLTTGGTTLAVTPDSPEVRAMVKKGVAFLSRAGPGSQRGATALAGLAVIKAKEPPTHPVVKAAVAASRAEATFVSRSGVGDECYGTCICAIFLCELDPQQYRAEIEVLLRGIAARQRANGCWGYKFHQYDDTSQSQFGMLALWAAHNNGFQVTADQAERGLNWFMRVQDVGGGWRYDPKDPQRSQRVAQGETTPGMTAAGLGALYVGSHLLGLTAGGGAETTQQEKVDLPPALKSVDDKEKETKPIVPLRATRTSFDAVKAAQTAGEAWFAKKGWQFKDDSWPYYYIYGLERCMSFREKVTNKFEKEPEWYNAGVAFLKANQSTGDGSWKSSSEAIPGTAFAILFLTRSTQSSLERVESGRMRGGKTLPDDLSQIAVDSSGRVKDTKETPPIDLLMEQLENGDVNAIDSSIPAQLKLSSDPGKRANELVRLRRMVMNGAYQARLTAVKTIGRDRNFDNVPFLIFALSDPDYRVVKAAQNGLRYISRRVGGFGLKVGDKPPTKPQYVAAQAKWKDWYLAIRPDGALIE